MVFGSNQNETAIIRVAIFGLSAAIIIHLKRAYALGDVGIINAVLGHVDVVNAIGIFLEADGNDFEIDGLRTCVRAHASNGQRVFAPLGDMDGGRFLRCRSERGRVVSAQCERIPFGIAHAKGDVEVAARQIVRGVDARNGGNRKLVLFTALRNEFHALQVLDILDGCLTTT